MKWKTKDKLIDWIVTIIVAIVVMAWLGVLFLINYADWQWHQAVYDHATGK